VKPLPDDVKAYLARLPADERVRLAEEARQTIDDYWECVELVAPLPRRRVTVRIRERRRA
jgi:hypothetical protein